MFTPINTAHKYSHHVATMFQLKNSMDETNLSYLHFKPGRVRKSLGLGVRSEGRKKLSQNRSKKLRRVSQVGGGKSQNFPSSAETLAQLSQVFCCPRRCPYPPGRHLPKAGEHHLDVRGRSFGGRGCIRSWGRRLCGWTRSFFLPIALLPT